MEEAAEQCPYLLERCVVAIVRAAIHLLHFSSPLSISPNTTSSNSTSDMITGSNATSKEFMCPIDTQNDTRTPVSESGEDHELIKAVWNSLRLLKVLRREGRKERNIS